MIELLFQIFIEVGAYFIGKCFAKVFIPSIDIEKLSKQKSSPKWKWKGFTYQKNDKKYFYTEAIQVIGLLIIVFVAIVLIAMVQYAN